MANEENLKRLSPSEAREYGRRGGKASGEARRKRADFRKTLNALLTVEIDNPEWTPVLEAMGIEPTLEAAVNAAMIREALLGNVKAYEAIARYSGQSNQTDADLRNQQADTELKRARKQAVTGENETDDAIRKLDEILKEVREHAAKQQAE